MTVLMSMSTMSAKGAESLPAAKLLESVKTPVAESHNLLENLKSFEMLRSDFSGIRYAMKKAPQQPMRVQVNSTVKSEVIVDEDFSKWTEGTNADPSSEAVTEEQLESLMNYTGEWTAFRMYEAGGAGYMGFDEIGDEGPGYLKSPSYDFSEGGENYYRFTCHVKNVNANAQAQNLQAFILDEAISSMIAASAEPMEYEEWVDCEWIGASNSTLTSFMVLGWQGKVLINGFKIEKLIFPLATPVVIGAQLLPDGSVEITWEKVDGANEYTIEVQQNLDIIATEKVGDVDSCVLNFEINNEAAYAIHVTAHNGEEISFPGNKTVTLIPQYVGTAIAKAATDVTEEGFTANWEAAEFASNYLVMPTVTHTAAENGEEFYYLNELFANVPESADEFSPIVICPMLEMGGIDLYMSRAGWTVDMGMFVRMSPEMPLLALTSQYAMYGLPGALVSPMTDYSVGNGTVRINGMGFSAVDDVVMTCGFMNATGEIYSSETFEVTTEGTAFDVELTGGQADSYLIIRIEESAEGGDMVLMPMLSVSTILDKDETVTVPVETVHTANVTEARVEVPVNENNTYSYRVQGYFSAALMGAISESVEVGTPTGISAMQTQNNTNVYAHDGIVSIVNPDKLACEIYTLDGKCVYTTSSDNARILLAKGVYIVKINNKSFKVMN